MLRKILSLEDEGYGIGINQTGKGCTCDGIKWVIDFNKRSEYKRPE